MSFTTIKLEKICKHKCVEKHHFSLEAFLRFQLIICSHKTCCKRPEFPSENLSGTYQIAAIPPLLQEPIITGIETWVFKSELPVWRARFELIDRVWQYLFLAVTSHPRPFLTDSFDLSPLASSILLLMVDSFFRALY